MSDKCQVISGKSGAVPTDSSPVTRHSSLPFGLLASGRDIPLFANTEEALRYGAAIRLSIPAAALDHFCTLVRTYFATQHALACMDLSADLQGYANIAYRLQTLREAIQEFLRTSAAESGAQGDPVTSGATRPIHASLAVDHQECAFQDFAAHD